MKPQLSKKPLKESKCLLESYWRFYQFLPLLFLNLFPFSTLSTQTLSAYENGRVIPFSEKKLSDAKFDIKSFAYKAGIRRVQLFCKIKALADKSPSIFVRTIRLQKAKTSLLTTDLHISEIAFDVGFNDPTVFSRIFRDEIGISPSEFREEHHD